MIPVFGELVEGQHYVPRAGGYGVVVGPDRRIGVVEMPDGVFLIGGGLEGDESPADALVREAREECGLILRVTGVIGCADELSYARTEGRHLRRSGTFFTAEIVGQDKDLIVERDHEFAWLRREEALRRLVHGSHRWAVEKTMVDLS